MFQAETPTPLPNPPAFGKTNNKNPSGTNRQFHLMNSVRRVSGGRIKPEQECVYVEIISTLDSEYDFDQELKRISDSQVAGSSKDIDGLWKECSRADGLNFVNSLWHTKAIFMGICLAQFPLSSGEPCKIAVVSTYEIDNFANVKLPLNSVSSLPGKDQQSHQSYHRFRVIQVVEDLMLETIRRLCQFTSMETLDAPRNLESLSESAEDQNKWSNIERDIQTFNGKPNMVELILCLDGERTRGYIVAGILRLLLEKFPEVDITTVFDRIYGTSAGAIVAAGLWSGAFSSCGDLQESFVNLSTRIFPEERHSHSWFDMFWGNEKYKSKPVDQEIFKYFHLLSLSPGSTRMRKIIPELVIHTTDASVLPWRPKLYRSSSDAYSSIGASVRASVAAPMYIPPMIVHEKSKHMEPVYRQLIDGGILNNDPTGSALADYFANPRAETNYTVIISIGTGAVEHFDAMNFSSISTAFDILATSSIFEGPLPALKKRPMRTKIIRMQPSLGNINLDSLDELSQAIETFPNSHANVWSTAIEAIDTCIKSGICQERLELKRRVADYVFSHLETCHERIEKILTFQPCPMALPDQGNLFNGISAKSVKVERTKLKDEQFVRFVTDTTKTITWQSESWRECQTRNYCVTDGFRMHEVHPNQFHLISVRYPQMALGLTAMGLVLVKARTERYVFELESPN